MGTPQETNAVDFFVSREADFDETISNPTMQGLPTTGESVGYVPTKVQSENLRSDRMRDGESIAAHSAGGALNFEFVGMSSTNGLANELLLEGALYGNMAAQTLHDGDVSIAAGKIHHSNIAAELARADGQYVHLKGFTNPANNGLHRVTAIEVDDLTVASTLVNEAAGAGKQLRIRHLTGGVVAHSHVLAKHFVTTDLWTYYTGLRIAQYALNIAAEQRVTGSVTFEGSREIGPAATIAGTYNSAGSLDPMTASIDVASLMLNDAVLTTGVQSLSLLVTNNLRRLPVVGSPYTKDIRAGFADITGTLRAYFEDATLYNLAKNNTDVKLVIPMLTANRGVVISLPRLKLTPTALAAQGPNGEVMVDLTWRALRHATQDAQIWVDAFAF